MKKVELFTNAINALVEREPNEVYTLMRKYSYDLPDRGKNSNLSKAVQSEMATNTALSADIVVMMKRTINQSNFEGGDTGNIISSALQGIGMITNTWQNTAQIKANATMYAADKSIEKSMTPLQLAGLVFGGIVILIIGAVVVVKAAH